ncbi:unnamed protein product, partial [marine sediment metagenome]
PRLNDDLAQTIREGMPELLDKLHAGQVVPVEDAEKIIDLVQGDIYLEPCICRKYYGGKEKMSCMFFPPVSEGMKKNIPWFGGKMISKVEAKKVLRELDNEGILYTESTHFFSLFFFICLFILFILIYSFLFYLNIQFFFLFY